MDSDWLSTFLLLINWKRNHSRSYSNDIGPLCCYRYTCDVEFAILKIKFRMIFKTISTLFLNVEVQPEFRKCWDVF